MSDPNASTLASLDPIVLAGSKAKGKRPYFLDDPDTERLASIVMVMAQEFVVLRQRVDTIERLLEAKGTVSRAQVDLFKPDFAATAERGAWTAEYLARVFRILQQEEEAIDRTEPSSEEVGMDLARS